MTVTGVDEAPVITTLDGNASSAVSAPEDQTAVTDVDATDPEGAAVTYSLSGGADQGLFSIVSSTGVLTFISAPDRENPTDADTDNAYVVEVTASDGSLTGAQTITVTVTDANDPPAITTLDGNASSAVSAAENQTAVTDVDATDPEGASLTYSLSGGADQGLFSIVSSTGVLTFSSAPNFESPTDADADNAYVVQVSASDGFLADTQTITVTVTGVDEAPIITTLDGNASSAVSAAENQTEVTDVDATDPEGASVTYSLTGGADQSKFSVVSSTGVLTFINAPNFESPTDADTDNAYVVEVTASDGSLTDVQTITVTVTDANDPPAITTLDGNATSAVSAAENQTAVTDVDATDPEGASLTYSLSGGADQGLFSIVSSTGVLTFISAPNFESPTDADANNAYVVQVTASDGSQTDTQTITVTMTGVDEAPAITTLDGNASSAVSVAENQTAVTDVDATDPEGASVTYSLTGGADQSKFSVVSSTGVLTFINAPNFESPTDADTSTMLTSWR